MTSPLDVCKEQQENEKEAIQAIYPKEAEFAKNSWKVWRPIDVILKLQPSESGSRIGGEAAATEPRASADLHVACSDRYPDDAPRVEVLNVRGIATSEQQVLKERLAERVKEKKGEQMILDLAELVREFLADNRPQPKGSFHQEMLEKQRKEQSEMKRAAETMMEKEKAEIESEQERREEEKRRQKEEAIDGERRRRESEAVEGAAESASRKIGSKKVFLVQEDIPQRKGLHPLCHEWYGVWERESILVSEWKFSHNLGRKGDKPMELETLKMRLSAVEKEADTMVELEEVDDGLARIAFVVVTTTALTSTNINIRIYIAQRVPKAAKNLDNLISSVKRDESALRRLTLQVVCGLRWLHDQNMIHGSLTSSAVWQTEGRSYLLSDCVILRLVMQVVEAFKECTGSTRGVGDAGKKEKGYTKKKDVFALGCMLDQLALYSPESSSDSSPPHSNELADFIQLCQSSSSAEELLDHPFLLQDVQPTSSTASSVSPFSRASRLIKEFNIFKWLGKGGFGEVTLARNKLDGNDYAVKTIALNPGNESLNRRVTREAKIFSKLNHPNVVRYFAAWTEDMVPDEAEGTRGGKKNSVVRKGSSMRGGGMGGGPEGDSLLPSRLREIEARAAVAASGEWSSSYQVERSSVSSSSSDDESTGERGKLKGRTLFSPEHVVEEDESYGILFEQSGLCHGDGDEGEEESDFDEEVISTTEESTRTERAVTRGGGGEITGMTRNTEAPPTRMLYIQMEYCARGTLRSMIDHKSFVNDPKKIWRVFGEILSGLQYIHRQDMIHRDIKPMNILLDSKEHVKIGDFGLATRQFFSKIAKKGVEEGVEVAGGTGGGKSSDLTMDIGTELYMAPELFKSTAEIPYTNKIDVYSAGIVLFEMFHRPLPPGMERISTLKTLKSSGTVPTDFAVTFTSSQASNARRLIESMLCVDAGARPSVTSILEDDRISFNDSEEDTFKKQLIKTVKSRSGLLFKYVMETLVKEEPTKAQAYLYDSKICKERFDLDRESSMGTVITQLAKLLQLHAFKPMSSPFLRASIDAKKETSRTKPVLMVDQSGFPVTLPFDLRANFVRMVSRNNVFRLKRYTIGRSFGYGELPGGVHPTERWECSVDAVGPMSSALTLSLSIISILVSIAAGMVEEQVRCVLRVGHIGLIRAALLHDGLAEEKHENVLNSIAMKKGKEASKELRASLPSVRSTVDQLRGDLKSLLRARDDRVREVAKMAIDEIEELMDALWIADESSLSRVEILLDPLLVVRPAVFSDGLVFQLELMSSTQKRPSILAQGGRYDHLLAEERHSKDHEFNTPIALVGCSVSLDLLVNSGGGTFRPPTVVVCSHAQSLVNEKLQLTSSLRKRGVITDVFEGTMKENGELSAHFDEFCARSRVEFVLVFLQKDEVLVERLNDKYELKMSPSEAVDYVSGLVACSSHLSALAAPSASDTTVVVPPPVTPTHRETRSMASVNVVCGLSEKWQHNTKKKIETQVANTLADSLSVFRQQTIVNVIVVSIEFPLVKQIAGTLTRTSVPSELITLFDSLQKIHGKAKEELEQIFEVMTPFFKEKQHNPSPIVLFRSKDNLFRYIM